MWALVHKKLRLIERQSQRFESRLEENIIEVGVLWGEFLTAFVEQGLMSATYFDFRLCLT